MVQIAGADKQSLERLNADGAKVSMRNFYAVLDVAPKASDAEIKSAFRNLAKTCHPDVKPGDRAAAEIFQEAKRAYAFLSNPETRKMYDDFLADRRTAKRRRFLRAATTMSATFALTTVAAMLAMVWLHGRDPPFAGRLFAEMPVVGTAAERPREPGAAHAAVAGALPEERATTP
jgi:curved DNA-binding protein CbpA